MDKGGSRARCQVGELQRDQGMWSPAPGPWRVEESRRGVRFRMQWEGRSLVLGKAPLGRGPRAGACMGAEVGGWVLKWGTGPPRDWALLSKPKDHWRRELPL